ncbi:MAG: tetratricopeptide repeat-containing sensor histidine kinase [Bacteroidia bacterium]
MLRTAYIVMMFLLLSQMLFAEDVQDTTSIYRFRMLINEANALVLDEPEKARPIYRKAEILLKTLIRNPDFNGLIEGISEDLESVMPDLDIDSLERVFMNQEALPVSEVVRTYEVLIQVCHQSGEAAKLYKYYFDAIDFAQESHDANSEISFLISLADYYTNTAQYAYAIKRFDQALELIKSGDDISHSNKVRWFHRYTHLKNSLKEPKEVIVYAQKAIDLMGKDSMYRRLAAVSYNEVGMAYFGLGNYQKSSDYLQKAVTNSIAEGDSANAAISELNLARVYIKLENFSKAIKLLKSSLRKTIGVEINWASIACASRLSEIYETKEDFESALSYEKISRFYLYYIDIKKQFSEAAKIQAEYESKDNLSQIRLQKNQIESIQQKKKNQLWITILAITFLVVILTLSFLYGRKLEQKTVLLNDSLLQNEVLLKEVHHRVKNNLMTLSGIFYLHENEIENPEEQAFLEDCQNRIHNMAMVHQKLYESENMSEIHFESYCRDLINSVSLSHAVSDLSIKQIVDCDNVSFEIDKAIPLALILTEFTTNSFKHAFGKSDEGFIEVKLRKEESQLHLIYADSGPGLPHDFEIEDSNTLGMKLVRILADQIDAEITYSNSGKSQFTLSFMV